MCAAELGEPLLFVSIVRLLCSGVGWHFVCVQYGVLCDILYIVFMFLIAEVFLFFFFFQQICSFLAGF